MLCGYSQESVARVIGVTDAAIGKMERAETCVPARDLYIIARYLKTDLYSFYKDTIENLSGPQLEEAATDFTRMMELSDFIERTVNLLSDVPEDERLAVLRLVGELIQKLKSQGENKID